VIAPLDREGCRRLADAIGDTPTWSIMTHALLTGRGRAYVIGDIENFDAALVAPDYCADEPQAWGTPDAIWQILAQLNGWTAIEVPREIAPALAGLVTRHSGRPTKLVDDIFFVTDTPPPPADLAFEHPAVRLLTLDDLDLLAAAPQKLSGGDVALARRMLSEAIYAAAIVDGRIVARVEAYARSPRYANLGAYVLAEFRRRGFATACAALVTRAVLAAGQTAVWSTGESNPPSQAVARKLGFRELPRTSTYVIRG
jgi:RimJ/RimL family protein N-acetyltransferase